MHPVLLKFGPLTLYTYGLMLIVAFAVATWQAVRAARRLPPELLAIGPEQLVDFSCLGLLGGLLGARVWYVVSQWEWFVHSPLAVFAIWQGGLVWYGGFLGGVAAGWLYTRAKRLVFLRVMDQFIPFLALGHAIGRIGCFFNGCCYGKPTDSWCGVVFPGHPAPVLPTQLFESFGLLVLYGILRALQRQAILAHRGRLFGLYLIGYGALRFVIECFRGDQSLWWAGLTLPQWMSFGLAAAGLGLTIKGKRQKEKGKTTIEKVKF